MIIKHSHNDIQKFSISSNANSMSAVTVTTRFLTDDAHPLKKQIYIRLPFRGFQCGYFK